MKKILLLDFDGVLFDTLREVYLVNRYLYKGIDFLDEINLENYERFSKYKYLVYNIWMFYYYNPVIFSNTDKIEQEFKAKLIDRDQAKELQFCSEFLGAREVLVQNHRDFWQNLEQPYQFFFEIKKLYEEKSVKMLVVSKKNKNAILQRFKTYGLNFDENDVFAREILDNYHSKGDFIKEYMEQNGYNSALFVDDNNNNLLSTVTNPKVERLLALWGNPQPNIQGYSEQEAIEKVKNYCMSK